MMTHGLISRVSTPLGELVLPNTRLWNADPQWQKQMSEFWIAMRVQMERNEHKGMRDSWLKYNLDAAFQHLNMSVQELRLAVAMGIDIQDKAVDVANWPFIIWDNFYNNPANIGGLIPPEKRFT